MDGTRARLRRAVLGQQRKGSGYAVRDNFDYWPAVVDKPAPGNANWMGTPQTPAVEVPEGQTMMTAGTITTTTVVDGKNGGARGSDTDDEHDDEAQAQAQAQALADRETVEQLQFDVAVVG